MSEYNTTKRNGFTLIELVVVVSILAIVGVMVIPSLRTLNEDRKVRDTARVVGAVFAAARERAAVDGQAGVEILSLPNDSGTYNLPNMGLVLYQMRNLPKYPGDTASHVAALFGVTPPLDLQNPGVANIRFRSQGVDFPLSVNISVGDFIELGVNGVLYEVINSDPLQQNIQIKIPFYQPIPPFNPLYDPNVIPPPSPSDPDYPTELQFRVQRKPIRIESSKVRLPNNLFLNLAFSGCTVGGDEFRLPEDDSPYASTQVWFANDGSITRVSYLNLEEPLRGMVPATSPINLLMCSANRESADLTNLADTAFLLDDNSMWITIDNRTGGVTMGKMAQITDLNASRPEQIRESQLLARGRRSATP